MMGNIPQCVMTLWLLSSAVNRHQQSVLMAMYISNSYKTGGPHELHRTPPDTASLFVHPPFPPLAPSLFHPYKPFIHWLPNGSKSRKLVIEKSTKRQICPKTGQHPLCEAWEAWRRKRSSRRRQEQREGNRGANGTDGCCKDTENRGYQASSSLQGGRELLGCGVVYSRIRRMGHKWYVPTTCR